MNGHFLIRGKTNKGQKTLTGGFALIEVLVSLAVFAIGITAVLTAILSALDLQKDSERRFRAGLILQEKLAEITVVQYSRIQMQGVSPDGEFNWLVTSEPWNGLQRPAQDPRASAPVDSLSGQLLEVAVDVSWQTTKGARSVTATQLVRIQTKDEELP